MRLTEEEIKQIKKRFGVNELWSFSKFDSYRTSHYEWMLKYLKHAKEDNEKVSAYAPIGGIVHDITEKLYEGNIKYEDMYDEFDDLWITNIDVVGLVFDRNDSDKNNNIKNKYYNDITHFFTHYQMLPYKMHNEEFVAIKITDDIVMQGYIDAWYKDDEGYYNIVDYKTSTKYSGKAIRDHAAQLVLYSEGLRQSGIPKDKIRCCWNFLKYVNVDCEQVNGKIKTRTVERFEIGNKLKAPVKVWLKKLGYENDMDDYLEQLVLTNDIACLPEDVQKKFVIHDCYTYVDDIWDFYEELKEEIVETIAEIREKTRKYKALKAEKNDEAAEQLFWDDEETIKAQSYYFNNLSGYSIKTIRPYKSYLDNLQKQKEGNIFTGLSNQNNNNKDEIDEDDLSWLDSI